MAVQVWQVTCLLITAELAADHLVIICLPLFLLGRVGCP